MGKMDELIAEAQASPVLTMDQWYEMSVHHREQGIDHSRWLSARTRYYGARDRRGRFVGEIDNSIPLVQELQRNPPVYLASSPTFHEYPGLSET